MRSNFHTIEFTYIEFTILQFLLVGIYRAVQSLLSSHFRTFSSTQKETQYPLAVTPRYHHHPSPGRPLIYFLSLQICLFWTLRINGSLWTVVFLVGFFHLPLGFRVHSCCQNASRLAFLCVNDLSLREWPNDSPLYGYTSVFLGLVHMLANIWIASTLGLLWVIITLWHLYTGFMWMYFLKIFLDF